MSNVLLIILLIVSLIMTGLILIQQSEGGALGIGGGGGGGGGGFMSGRSAANSVSSMTWIFGTAFLVLCLVLTVVFNNQNQNTSILDETGDVAPLTIPTESRDMTDPLAGISDPTDSAPEQLDPAPADGAAVSADPVDEDSPAQPQASDDK